VYVFVYYKTCHGAGHHKKIKHDRKRMTITTFQSFVTRFLATLQQDAEAFGTNEVRSLIDLSLSRRELSAIFGLAESTTVGNGHLFCFRFEILLSLLCITVCVVGLSDIDS